VDRLHSLQSQLDENGYALLASVYSTEQVQWLLGELERVLAGGAEGVLGRDGTVYASRNVLQLWPAVRDVCRPQPMVEILRVTLGPDYGLVRALFFDKPPGRSWALPWHKDLTVAVKDNSQAPPGFTHPTTKAGVPHLEAPTRLIERMVTARIHLDSATSENGPLKVIAGSHRSGKQLSIGDAVPQTILANAGDVLLMRPLLAHCSGHARENATVHRRILHLEFAGIRAPGDGLEWHDFVEARKAMELW
jgi:ectoine hydroxylase-related dioxygenase (phytanoyl-CoA dioxygenase family)